ncbi:hypothetical protein C7S18_18860 [Ahniella affigens]|uniref:Uncharacterized protein n=1 Tax=Ahniella affigens TaxID=2021234 RepID=A0A2P1PW97_9GAMM|nr:hypothetical protein [Ahniella affigens]AVP99102.1 hypothetical protein C7S18_18860 [Ahniella affigens]
MNTAWRIIVLLGLSWPIFAAPSREPPDAKPPSTSTPQVLQAVLDLHDRWRAARGQELAPASVTMRKVLARAGNEAFWRQLPLSERNASALQRRLQSLATSFNNAANGPISAITPVPKAIEFPEPAPMSRCVSASAATAHAMLEAWAASSEILAAAKWACLQTEAGENSAFLCTALAIETEALQTEYDQESFCLGDQRDATLSALAQTQSNVVDHLNQRADATVSSRATQSALDTMQDSLDSLLIRLAELRTTVSTDDHQANAELADLLDDALALANGLTALAADIHDAQFRMQAAQVNVEDVQDRLADLQAMMLPLTQHGEAIRGQQRQVADALTAAQTAQQTAASEQRDRHLALALGAPNRVVIRYRLPAAQGGELERSREVLIRALNAYAALGINTDAASAKLVAGDQAYNLGNPLEAYDLYGQAYRLLTTPGAAPSSTMMRSSFE